MQAILTAADLFEYLHEKAVHLFVGRDLDTGRPTLGVVADPYHAIDTDNTRGAIRHFEAEIIARLLEHRRSPTHGIIRSAG